MGTEIYQETLSGLTTSPPPLSQNVETDVAKLNFPPLNWQTVFKIELTPQDIQHEPWLFQASICNCLNCIHNCDDHGSLDFKSAVQYMKHFLYHFTSILHGLIRTHKRPAPNFSGFIAQLVRASHRYREVTGSNPVEVLTFSGFYTQLLKLRS